MERFPQQSHACDSALPAKTPPKEHPHTTETETPPRSQKKKQSLSSKLPVTSPLDTTTAPASTAKAGVRSKSASATVSTKLARGQLRPHPGQSGGTATARPAASRYASAGPAGRSASAATKTRQVGGGGANGGGGAADASAPVAVVPYLRPAGTPLVHVRIRPLLPYMGESVDQRKTWFLDGENVIVRPQPRIAHMSTSSIASLATSSASPTVPMLNLSSAAYTTSAMQSNAGRSPQHTPRKNTARGSGTTAATAPTTTSTSPQPQTTTSYQPKRTNSSGSHPSPDWGVGGKQDSDTYGNILNAASPPPPLPLPFPSAATTTTTFGSGGEQHYRFELVYGEDATQEEVFEESVSYLIDEALLGQNVAILCYGPTGSGKTYSMMGDPHERQATHASHKTGVSGGPTTTTTTTAMNSSSLPQSLGGTMTATSTLPLTPVTATTSSSTPRRNESPATDVLSETRVSSLTAPDDDRDTYNDDDDDDDDDERDNGGETTHNARHQSGQPPRPHQGRRGRSSSKTKADSQAVSSSPAEVAAATLAATAEKSGWMTVDPRHRLPTTTSTASTTTAAEGGKRVSAAPAAPAATPDLLAQLASSEMGILPRLVCALLERRGETVVLRQGGDSASARERDPDASDADATEANPSQTAPSGKGEKKAPTSTSTTPRPQPSTPSSPTTPSPPLAPASSSRVTLTLEDIHMYGVELYLDEVFDLLNAKKQPVPHMGDTGGLAAFCQTLDRANSDRLAATGQGMGTPQNNTSSSSRHRGGGGWSIHTINDLRRVCRIARRNRVTSSHQRNDSSSRSHAVFILQLGFDLTIGDGQTSRTARAHKAGGPPTSSSLSTPPRRRVHSFVALVDLAGCERVKETQVAGTSLKEAQYINKSLSALSSVVLSLHRRSQHVPYRDAKLTRLLRPCLEGGRVLTLVHVSPCSSGDSMNALKFAHQIRHTMVKPHNYISGTNQDELQTIFEGLMDPAQGKLEEALHKTQHEYEQLCAEVRIAYYSRATQDPAFTLTREGPGLRAGQAYTPSGTARRDGSGGRPRLSRGTRLSMLELSSASSSSRSSTLNVSGEDEDEDEDEEDMAQCARNGRMRRLSVAHLLPSLPDAKTDEDNFLHPFTTELSLDDSATAAQRRAFLLHTLVSRDLAPRLARDEAKLRVVAHAAHLEKRREVEVHRRAILQAAESLRAKIEDAELRHARLQQENMNPVPTDPYAQELSALVKDTTESVAATVRERQQLTSLLATLKQRLALQDEVESTVDEEVAELRSKLRHGALTSESSDAVAFAAGTYAALLDVPEDAEMKEISRLQVQTARDLSALRLETACFGMGEAIWEGLWARAMRQELYMAMRAERLLMERVLLQDAALETIAGAEPPSPRAAGLGARSRKEEEESDDVVGMPPPAARSTTRSPATSPRLTAHRARKNSLAGPTEDRSAEAVTCKKAALQRFMAARAEAHRSRESTRPIACDKTTLTVEEGHDGGEAISPIRQLPSPPAAASRTTGSSPAAATEQPVQSESGPISRAGGVRRTSRPLVSVAATTTTTSQAPTSPTPSLFCPPALSFTGTGGGGTMWPVAAGGGGQEPNPLEHLVAASLAYRDAQSRRASLRTGLLSPSIATSIDSALLTSGNTSVLASALAQPGAEPAAAPSVNDLATPHRPLPAAALPQPSSLVGVYHDELSLQRASVARLLEEGIPCEVSCIGDNFSNVWSQFLVPAPSSSVFPKSVGRRQQQQQTLELDALTPLRQPALASDGGSPMSASVPQSTAKKPASDEDEDIEEGSEERAGDGEHTRGEEAKAAAATLMSTHWGRLRLVRSPQNSNVFSLEFVYLKDGGLPLPQNLATALATPVPKRDAREELLDSLPSSLDLRRGLTPPSSSPAALRSPAEQATAASRERRLFTIPLSEPELTLKAHVIESGAATASPYWSSRRSRVRCRRDETTQIALELCHVPMTSTHNKGSSGNTKGEGVVDGYGARGTPKKSGKSLSQSSPSGRGGGGGGGRRAMHIPSTQPLAPTTATPTAATTTSPDRGGESPSVQAGHQHSLQSVVSESEALRKRAVRMRSVVLAKRLQGGSELLLPSSCILGNSSKDGSCTLLVRFPEPHFSNCTRLENVETVVAALCALLNPMPQPATATAASSPLLGVPRSPRAPASGRAHSGMNSARRGADVTGSGSGRLSARQRRSSDAEASSSFIPPLSTSSAGSPLVLIHTHGHPSVVQTLAHIPRVLLEPDTLARSSPGHDGEEVTVVADLLAPPSERDAGEQGGVAVSSRGVMSSGRPLRGAGTLVSARPHDGPQAQNRRRSLPLSLSLPTTTTTTAASAQWSSRSRPRDGSLSHTSGSAGGGKPGRTATLTVTLYFPGALPSCTTTTTTTTVASEKDNTNSNNNTHSRAASGPASDVLITVPSLTFAAPAPPSSCSELDTFSLISPNGTDSSLQRRHSMTSVGGSSTTGGPSSHTPRLSRARTPRASGMGLDLSVAPGSFAEETSTGSGGAPQSSQVPMTTTTPASGTATAAVAHVPVFSEEAMKELHQIQLAAGLMQQLREVTVGGETLESVVPHAVGATDGHPSGGSEGHVQKERLKESSAPSAASRDAQIALGLHQLQAFRRSVRAVVKQQAFDAEDIKGDYVGAFQVAEGEKPTGQARAPLMEVRDEALAAIGLQLPGVQPPPPRGTSRTPSRTRQDETDTAGQETTVLPARGDVSVNQGRELGSFTVPWTVWHWAYRWSLVSQCYTAFEQAQQHAYESQGGGAAGEMLITTTGPSTTTAAATGAGGGLFPVWTLTTTGDGRVTLVAVAGSVGGAGPVMTAGKASTAAGASSGVSGSVAVPLPAGPSSPLLGPAGGANVPSDSDDDDFAYTFGRGPWMDEETLDTVHAPPKTVWLPALRFTNLPAFLEVPTTLTIAATATSPVMEKTDSAERNSASQPSCARRL